MASVRRGKGIFMPDLKADVEKIVAKHKHEFMLNEETAREYSGEDGVRFVKNLRREFDLMHLHLVECKESFDDYDAVQMIDQIRNKLAVSETRWRRVRPDEWWWLPAQPVVEKVLREVQRNLEKATEKKRQRWFRILRYARHVLVELVYVTIVWGVFTAANSKFEEIVFAVLVMIYNSVGSVGSALGMGVVQLLYSNAAAHGEFMRSLNAKASVTEVNEAAKTVSVLTVEVLIHNVSIGIGTLIALWHLVTAIVR
jgi:hypothetical protein